LRSHYEINHFRTTKPARKQHSKVAKKLELAYIESKRTANLRHTSLDEPQQDTPKERATHDGTGVRSATNESLLHGIPVIPAEEKIEGQLSRCSNCSSFEHLIEQLANGAMRFADGCAMIWRAG
jgi:hypothetical protein